MMPGIPLSVSVVTTAFWMSVMFDAAVIAARSVMACALRRSV